MDPALYEPFLGAGADSLRSTRFRPRVEKGRRPVAWITAGAAFALLGFLGLAWTRETEHPPPWAPAQQPDPGKRIYLRAGGFGSEGFGSALQHFKQSVIFSRALNSTLILASENSSHGYSTSDIYNGHRDSAVIDARNACRMKDHLPQSRRSEIANGWCAGEESALAEMERVKAEMADCTGILDVDENETTEDLNGCVMGWVRERLAPAVPPVVLPALTFPPQRPITVGIHIRWGDAGSNVWPWQSTYLRGSMTIPNITRVLKDIRSELAQEHGVRLTIAMENAEKRIIDQLHETEYTLVDSGDGLADLHALANQDILLLGESSWGVMVHLVAPGTGLTISETLSQHKYDNTTGFGRRVVGMEDYKAEILREGWMTSES